MDRNLQKKLRSNKYKKEIRLFFRFLKEKGVYESYLEQTNNFLSILRRDKPYTLMNELECQLPSAYVSGFFSWMCSKEGYLFWSQMHLVWNKVLGKYQRNYV